MNYDSCSPDAINDIFRNLMGEGQDWLDTEHVSSENRRFHNVIEMRYIGQNYELQIPVSSNTLDMEDIQALKEAFFKEHEKNYGYFNPTAPIQLVNFRSEAIGIVTKPGLSTLEHKTEDPADCIIEYRDVFFDETGFINCPVYDREKLGQTERIEGPCIIEQMDSTSVIPPKAWFLVDHYGNIIVTV